MSRYALGIDLGGSSIKSAAVNSEGQILARRNLEFDAEASMDWAQQIKKLVQEMQSELGAVAARLGLSAPGLVAPNSRSIASMPGRLAGLEGLDWTEFLQSTHPVPVLNDAHAALMGEAWIGAAPGLRNVFMLTLGTGVGGAAIVDGRLLRGHIGRAGHLGHIALDLDGFGDIIGTPGSLELLIGNCSIQERSGGRFTTTHDLIAAHRAGDDEATRIWRYSIKALAAGVASLINVLDPEAVVIGGGIARAGALLFAPLSDFLDSMEWRPGGHKVRIVSAKLGEFAGAIGAARYSSEINGR